MQLQNNKLLSLVADVLDAQGDPIEGATITWGVSPPFGVLELTPTPTGCVLTPTPGEVGSAAVTVTHMTSGAPLVEQFTVDVVDPVPTSLRITPA